jgi:3-oxoacyl-[acyl-carrier protein] reductase
MKLKNKIIFISGSSHHTGFGIAKYCLKEGAVVIINGIQESDVSEAAFNLRNITNGTVIEAPGDISKEKIVDRIFDIIRKETGRLDVLVHNACHLGLGPNFIEVDSNLWDDVFAVNVRGMFLCGQRAARMMRDQGGGVIVNIGSVQGIRAVRNRSAYVASKGAIESATRAMAVDLAAFNIRVNMVVPGYIWTSRWNHLDAETIKTRRDNIPLQQEATYEDVAKAVVFFASNESDNITGSSLVVDGGLTMQMLPSSLDI